MSDLSPAAKKAVSDLCGCGFAIDAASAMNAARIIHAAYAPERAAAEKMATEAQAIAGILATIQRMAREARAEPSLREALAAWRKATGATP